MNLNFESPDDFHIVNLAPTVEGTGLHRAGQYGYALCLVSEASMYSQGIAPPGCAGGVRVLWDDGKIEDVDSREIVFTK
jgi:hypothetical protein